MTRTTVAVPSGESALAEELRAKCPEVDLAADAPSADVVVSLAGTRVVLRARGSAASVEVDRGAFFAQPSEFLRVAAALSAVQGRVAQLEQRLSVADRLQELTRAAEPSAAYERLTTTVLSLLHLSYGTLLLHDARLERFSSVFNNDPEFSDAGDDYVPGISATLLQSSSNGQAYALQHPAEERQGLVAFPIQLGDEMFGVLRVPLPDASGVDPGRLQDAAEFVHAASPILASYYQLTRSNELVLRDDLTKAFNRRFFDAYLEEEIFRARRYSAVFSIIFLDLDDLKVINSRHGHLTGSRTLQEVAKRIMGAVRGIDKVVRFGGDEFCIILPQTDQEQAVAVAMRVRRAMVESSFAIEPGVDVRITASFGIATFPVHAATKEDLIKQADAAMLRVKSTTKNAIGTATA